MSLKNTAGRWLATASAGLGVTRWGSVLTTMGVVVAIASASGFWAGLRWERGAQAIADSSRKTGEIDALRGQVDDLVTAGRDLKQAGIDNSSAYRQAAERLGAIADGYERQRANQQAQALQQRRDLQQLLATRPDLGAVDVGQQLLDHWNRASRGSDAGGAATAATASDRTGAPAPVPGGIPAGTQQPAAGSAGQPRPRRRHVPRLRVPPDRAGRGGGGTGAHRPGVVLQGDRRARLQGGGVRSDP